MTGPAARALHPGAWWLWAAAAAVVAGRTTNLAVLALLAAATGYVVVARAPRASAMATFAVFARVALAVLVLRLVLQVLLAGGLGTTVLLDLPAVPLPQRLAGIRLGGAVTAEALLAAAGDAARVATVLLAFGAANTLASAPRLLRCLPRALHAFGVATAVAVSAVPHLVAAFLRIRTARRLRGVPVLGLRGGGALLVPVLEEALARALVTAEALEGRGFGRRAPVSAWRRLAGSVALLAGPAGLVLGAYLAVAGKRAPGVAALALAAGVCAWGLRLAGSGVPTTRYRRPPWGAPEWRVACCGGAAVASALLAAPGVVAPDPWRLAPPVLDAPMALAAVAVLLPAWLAASRGHAGRAAPAAAAGAVR